MPGQFKLISKNGDVSVYRKWDSVLQTRVTVTFSGKGEQKLMHVKLEQPTSVIDTILDNNVSLQNSFAGYGKGDGFYHATSIPLPIYNQLMVQCGQDRKTGEYDEKKFKGIVNGSDYSKLRVVPGRI